MWVAEKLIAKSDYLLIEGAAGSGKTTLLKHLTYCLAPQNRSRLQLEGLAGYLPLLIRLNEINDFFEAPDGHHPGANLEDLLAWYFEVKMGASLSIAAGMAFIQAEKAVILLDGLDELLPQHRKPIINAFADLRVRHPGCKLVLTSRPHGIGAAAINRLGKRHIKILALNPDQINLFIHKWFTHFYPGTSGVGRQNADAMINAVQSHPTIAKLTDTPLMLTAICILYHDGKELPEQRAELYKKFIDNLLYRRFDQSEQVHDFLKTLAFEMHTAKVKSVDRGFPVKVLKSVYKSKPDENEAAYIRGINALFDDIEPRCGLLQFESGQYRFWHLTFQEFLTADYIADNHSDHVAAIADYWQNDWWREVVELYISYLSIEHKKTANDIIADAVERPPFKRWLLAGRAMLDIHPNRRMDAIVAKVKDRLTAIMASEADPVIRAESGEILGWLGDERDLKGFIPIPGGEYPLSIGKQEIKPFEIGKHPVTNGWFAEFIASGGYDNWDLWTPQGRKWLEETNVKQPRYWNDRKWTCPNAPVVGVCWYEADAFCRWLTRKRNDGWTYRLPSETEWEAAAAGFEGRKYPWGSWEKGRCNSRESTIGKTSSMGVFQNGETPEGVADMAGNVWEWTCSDHVFEKKLADFTLEKDWEKAKRLPVLRGGSWYFDRDNVRCADRFGFIPAINLDNVGFRCSRTSN